MFSGRSHNNNNNDHNCNRNVMPEMISTPSKCIKSLVSISDERQAHLGDMFVAESFRLRAIGRTMVRLIDLVQWEVGDIDLGFKARFEGGTDAAQTGPVDAFEEVVGFDLRGAGMAGGGAKSVASGAEESSRYVSLNLPGR